MSAQYSKIGYFSVLLRAKMKLVSRRYKMLQMYTSVPLTNDDNHIFENMPLLSSTFPFITETIVQTWRVGADGFNTWKPVLLQTETLLASNCPPWRGMREASIEMELTL